MKNHSVMKHFMSMPFWLTVTAVVVGVTAQQVVSNQIRRARTAEPTATKKTD